MNITERAKNYAEGKALDAITAAIEQAYADGYNDGMRHRENEMLEAIKDGVEYVDLHLPSGTMWSLSYIKDKDLFKVLPYIEASKLNIPTKEDFEELCAYCAKDYYLTKDLRGIQFTGRNGKRIIIPYYEIKEIQSIQEHFHFWIKDDEETPKKYSAINGDKKDDITGYKCKIFMGYKLPIMLVRKK